MCLAVAGGLKFSGRFSQNFVKSFGPGLVPLISFEYSLPKSEPKSEQTSKRESKEWEMTAAPTDHRASLSSSPENSSRIQLLIRMGKLLRPVWRTALTACAVIVLRALAEVLSVYFLSPAITAIADQLMSGQTRHGPAPSFVSWLTGTSSSAETLRTLLSWMILTQIFLAMFTYLRSVWDTKLSMRVVFHMRAAVYDRLQRADLAFHDKMSSGQLINRAINDLQAVRQFVNLSLLTSLDIFASLAFYFGLLFLRSPWLMAAALLPIPFWTASVLRFSKKAQPIYQKQQEANDRLMSALSENLSGVHVVRAFGTENDEIAKYGRLNGRLVRLLMKSVGLQATLTPVMKLIATGSHVGLFVFAVWLIQRGALEVGDLLLIGAAMAAILAKLQQVNTIVEAYQKAIVSSGRLFEIMDLPQLGTPRLHHPGERLRISVGEIEFEGVNFSYGQRRTLDRVTARIPGGKITALVGPTGAGKSTLAGLIARFYDPHGGAIRIDGQDLIEVDLRDLRQRVGYVFQETFLFSSTIRDNIRYGRMDVSDEMVKRAAEIAMADEFIERLPQGYETLLGERGVMLSGGQRQRLALARALVYDPAILILDDATAALDATTEEVIHRRLDPVFKGRTVLLIANRLSSVAGADHVLVMEGGRITQAGTHDELVMSEGHYREIVHMQKLVEEGGALQGSA